MPSLSRTCGHVCAYLSLYAAIAFVAPVMSATGTAKQTCYRSPLTPPPHTHTHTHVLTVSEVKETKTGKITSLIANGFKLGRIDLGPGLDGAKKMSPMSLLEAGPEAKFDKFRYSRGVNSHELKMNLAPMTCKESADYVTKLVQNPTLVTELIQLRNKHSIVRDVNVKTCNALLNEAELRQAQTEKSNVRSQVEQQREMAKLIEDTSNDDPLLEDVLKGLEAKYQKVKAAVAASEKAKDAAEKEAADLKKEETKGSKPGKK